MTNAQRAKLAQTIATMTGSDAAVAGQLNAVTITTRETFVTSRGLVDRLGVERGAAILAKIEAAAAAAPPAISIPLRQAIEWLKPSNGGIDFGNAQTRQFIALLAGDQVRVLDGDDLAALLAIGQARSSPADALGFAPTAGDVAESRALLAVQGDLLNLQSVLDANYGRRHSMLRVLREQADEGVAGVKPPSIEQLEAL